MDTQHVKLLSTDDRSKNRLRFQSSKKRSKQASADVYRAQKGRVAGIGSSYREAAVHNNRENRPKKRIRAAKNDGANNGSLVKIGEHDSDEELADQIFDDNSFSTELDIALDRNPSELFSSFHRKVWRLVRSLPEVLHNAESIVDLLLSFMMSSATEVEEPSIPGACPEGGFVVNHATMECLHLLSVLARDLRQEIHPFIHSKILPRLFDDLLNISQKHVKKQQHPLDAGLVETIFRTLAYVFRYDSALNDKDMESMRKYYGGTLGHRNDLIRRLSSETFALPIRKMKNATSQQKHLKRVFRALLASENRVSTPTSVLLRALSDVSDGMALLLFNITRGASGVLHSKGHKLIDFVFEVILDPEALAKTTDEWKSCKILFDVASSFLIRICDKMKRPTSADILANFLTKGAVTITKHAKGAKKASPFYLSTIKGIFGLLSELTSHREGALAPTVKGQKPLVVDLMCKVVHFELFGVLNEQEKEDLVPVFCSLWTVCGDSSDDAKSMRLIVRSILSSGEKTKGRPFQASSPNLLTLLHDLLPHIHHDVVKTSIHSEIVSVAASMTVDAQMTDSLAFIVLAAKTTNITRTSDDTSSADEGDTREDQAMVSETWTDCSVPDSSKNKLLQFAFDQQTDDLRSMSIERLSVAVRSITPLVLLNIANDEQVEIVATVKRASKWIRKLIKQVHSILETSSAVDAELTARLRILAFSSIEAIAELVLSVNDRVDVVATVEQCISPVQGIIEKLILSAPTSAWSMKSCNDYCDTLNLFEKTLQADSNTIFEALSENLRSQSHFLRLYTLKVLTKLPKLPFVVSHAELDLQEDLDEDPTFTPQGEKSKSTLPQGLCDAIDVLLKIETTPIELKNERVFLSLISRIEVLARSGRLPEAYAIAATNHMIGLFNFKFSPIWSTASRAIQALLEGHENSTWPLIGSHLRQIVADSPDSMTVPVCPSLENERFSQGTYFQACLNLEASSGLDTSAFNLIHAFTGDSEAILKHSPADNVSSFEAAWGIVHDNPRILSKYSKVLVPIFLGFLNDQYYAYNSSDPDGRELRIADHVDNAIAYDKNKFDGHVLKKRLKSLLSAFSTMQGPQQLLKRDLIRSIFTAFMSHQDTEIASLALAGLIKFKQPWLTPHANLLQGMLKANGFRDVLLDFESMVKNGGITDENRAALVPVISRLLFGRLTSKQGGARQSKHSPAARRAAGLSFLSTVCKRDEELSPFLYLMTRSFIPVDIPLSPLEQWLDGNTSNLGDAFDTLDAETLPEAKGAVYEGFLNLLGTIIAQLGHRITTSIQRLTKIVIALSKLAEVREMETDHKLTESEEDGAEKEKSTLRMGSIRSLCYSRMSDILEKYSGSVNFRQFSRPLWDSLALSLEMLPEMSMASSGAPALLGLLAKMTYFPSTIDMLGQHPAAIEAVLKCMDRSSSFATVQFCLSFIENLADDVDSSNSRKSGQQIVLENMPLIFKQFINRFGGKKKPTTSTNNRSKNKSEEEKQQQTAWRQELRIMFKLSEIILSNDEMLPDDVPLLEELLNLIVPLLALGRSMSDVDRLHALGIIKTLIPKIGADCALDIFFDLAAVLPPKKGSPGLASFQIRMEVAHVMSTIAESYPSFEDIASAVKGLSATSAKRVEELDLETVIPIMNGLTKTSDGESRWTSMLHTPNKQPSMLAPIVNIFFNFLYDTDMILARTALSAIKEFLNVASEQMDKDGSESELWQRYVESSVIPMIRGGLSARNAAHRRYFLLLIAHAARKFRHQESQYLHGDLFELCDDENPDLDFFSNMTHVQLHRRARGFKRLREFIKTEFAKESGGNLSVYSISNVLLPLVIHPVYECVTNAEELLVVEAIATAGAISKVMSWSKYNHLLWTTLRQFEKYEAQERYITSLICSVLDGFHFDVTRSIEMNDEDEPEDLEEDDEVEETAVWRALERRIIPSVEALLTKEKTDRQGNKVKSLRPAVVLALLKLYQKFPNTFFEARLPRLLTILCDALKARDSNTRELARNTMAKVAISIDIKYLADIVRELAITLTEGYKLHVRSATVHTILMELEKTYKLYSPEDQRARQLSEGLDSCVMPFMDLIQQELFGATQERKDSEHKVAYVKEASGNKGVNSVEILCRIIDFKPSKLKDARKSRTQNSAVHGILTPLLQRLKEPEIPSATIRKIRDVLARAAIGFSKNSTINSDEILPFVYATIEPYIGLKAVSHTGMDGDEDMDTDSDEEENVIQVSGSKKKKTPEVKSKPAGAGVVEWRPSMMRVTKTGRAAHDVKLKERVHLSKVKDGHSAPKLTGSGRNASVVQSSINKLDDPSSIAAIIFGLDLLNRSLKTVKPSPEMVDPFIPLLTKCVNSCKDNSVILNAYKCLAIFLRFDLPSASSCARGLGMQSLESLVVAQGSSKQNGDLIQVCFKIITSLMILGDDPDHGSGLNSADLSTAVETPLFPFDNEQMNMLISSIKASISDSDQHHPALGLIKIILGKRYLSMDLYDLMDDMLKLTVRSSKASLRQNCGKLFRRFLVDYPLGTDKFEKYLKQVFSNVAYEYAEGRMSAIQLVEDIAVQLPTELLHKHANTMFLSLVLQLQNDDSKECRAALYSCISRLFERSSATVFLSLFEYTKRWADSAGPLQVAALQIFGFLIESKPEMFQKDEQCAPILSRVQTVLLANTSNEWEAVYFCLICIEKILKERPVYTKDAAELWSGTLNCMVHRHPWVKLASARIVHGYLQSSEASTHFAETYPDLVRNLCFQLNTKEEEYVEDAAMFALKSLSLLLPLMEDNQSMFIRDISTDDADDGDDKDDDEEGIEPTKNKNPVKALLRRLSYIAKPKGFKRRMVIFKCFAAFLADHKKLVLPFLESILEPIHRAILESSNEIDNAEKVHRRSYADGIESQIQSQSQFAKDLLQLVEDSCDSPEQFLDAYSEVKKRARDKKEQRKMELTSEYVKNPLLAAKRKREKHDREKGRKKRRSHERKVGIRR